ncbi:hypothetical protein BJX63DRAFT_345116 [Aspergillus granulosus]|uniref:Uncharacterized protein n=1 Tax=Aspergillus granulosus TaxID=176169 RepID=A0ABR4H2S2_9EURO
MGGYGVWCGGRSHASLLDGMYSVQLPPNHEVSLSVSSNGIRSRLTISQRDPFTHSRADPNPARPRQFPPLSQRNKGPRLKRVTWFFFI